MTSHPPVEAGAEGGPGTRRTYRLDVQYDGSGFYGWARQPGRRTVEECLEHALSTYFGLKLGLSVAGRTDTGVHARGQVASFHLPEEIARARGLDEPENRGRALVALRALTPAGLTVMRMEQASAEFDARRSATARSYRYVVWRGLVPSPFLAPYSWHVKGDLDIGLLETAAERMLGRHDFTAFTPTETHHLHFEPTVERCRWRWRGPLGWLEVRAPHFLRHMVRTMVGTMVEVGKGRLEPAELVSLLEGAPRTAAGPTAPPHGLFLWRIHY